MMIRNIAICLLLGYLFGNFQTSFIIGKTRHVDIREHGSGNAGTTNAFRTLGKAAGFLTFFGDFLKAIIPMLLVSFVFFKDVEYVKLLLLYTGFGTVLGHNFPFWLKFRGGKGIAVTSGVIVAFDPWMIIPAAIVFFGIVLVTKYVSVSSLALSLVLPTWICITLNCSPYFIHMLIVSLLFVTSAFIKHIPNIKRLANGTENKIGQHQYVKDETQGGN